MSRDVVSLPVGDYEIDYAADNEAGEHTAPEQRGTVQMRVRVVFVDLRTGPVDYDHKCTDVAGRMVSYPEGGPPAPAAGLLVRTLGSDTATTATDGGFAIQNCGAREVGVAGVRFESDGRYLGTHSSVATPVQKLETRITARYAQLPTIVGDTLTLTGRIERRTAAGSWVPVVGTRFLGGEDSRQDRFGIEVAADGRFTVQRRTTSDPSFDLGYKPSQQDESRFFQPSSLHLSPPPGTVERYRTRFQYSSVTPARIAKGDQATVTGWLVRDDIDWKPPIGPGAEVEVEYYFDHQQKPARHVIVGTNPQGRFQARFPVTASGCLHLRHRRTQALDLPAEQRICLDARTKTQVRDFRAHAGKHHTVGVSGTLLQRTQGWRPLARRQVTIYFRPDGSSRWTRKTVIVSDKRGAFAKTFKAAESGTWRAVFAGAAGYWDTQSSQVRIKI